MSDSRLVYSTELGRIKPQEDKPASFTGDGVVRIHRETKGRKGKGVSLIKGINPESTDIKQLCSTLKKKCGCGGAVKNDAIEIQTDDREKLKQLLHQVGITAKIAGG